MAIVFDYLPEDITGMGAAFYVALVMIFLVVVIDYLTGLWAGCLREGFSSTKMRLGLHHKATYLVVVLLCIFLEVVGKILSINPVLADGVTIMTLAWIFVTETGSILENLVKINPELGEGPFMKIFDKRSEDDVEDDMEVRHA